MAFQVSAGVEVKEIDLTNVVPAVSTSIGGFVGPFRWGPVEDIRLIGSETELANEFGKPKSSGPTGEGFFTAASFLKYGNALKAVRSTDSALKNAVSGGVGKSITTVSVANKPAAATDSRTDSPAAGSILGGITASSGVVSEFTVTSNDGSGAEIEANYNVSAIKVASAGSGYTEGDEVSIDLGEGQILPIKITTAADGIPSVLGLVTDGSNSPGLFTLKTPSKFSSVAASSLATANTSPSSGTGLQVDLTYAVKNFTVLEGGSGYDTADSPGLKIFADGTEIYPMSGGGPLSNLHASPSGVGVVVSGAAASTAALIKNEDAFESIKGSLSGDIFARYAGALGDNTRIYIVNASNKDSLFFNGTSNKVSDQFDTVPTGTELHIMVTSTQDAFTGNGTVETEVEKWAFLDATDGAKTADGANNYYVDRINQSSEWIFIPSAISSVTTLSGTTGVFLLGSGADQTSVTAGDISTGLDLLADSETVDVNLLFSVADSNGDNTVGNKVLSVATTRKDVVGFVNPAIADTQLQSAANSLANVKAYKASLSAPDSYGVIGSTSAYVYDKYNDRFLYIGTQGHLAGLCANTDRVAESWFSPGGFNRGQLRNITKLAYNPKKADRDELYKAGINPIVSFPGQGVVLFGDKTLQSKPSAFDRINVRRLFITLEKAISTAAKFQLFELNDEFTRATFRNLVEPFLRDVQGRRGITDFLVVCDETNNTGQVIDSNRFVADIFIKPARSINFITLNFIATRTGVEFSEIVGNV